MSNNFNINEDRPLSNLTCVKCSTVLPEIGMGQSMSCLQCGTKYRNKEFSLEINYLLSYPRSGNTWLRYCVEHLTGRNTIGYDNPDCKFELGIFPENIKVMQHFPGAPTNLNFSIDKKNLPILVKKHEVREIRRNRRARIILLIRDYKECIPSQTSQVMGLERYISEYLQLLEYYDSFSRDKTHIYYEDLIINTEECIRTVLDFIGETVNEKTMNEFLNNIDHHRNRSISIYGESKSGGSTTKFHQKNLEPDCIKSCEKYLAENFSGIVNKYLKRYQIRTTDE